MQMTVTRFLSPSTFFSTSFCEQVSPGPVKAKFVKFHRHVHHKHRKHSRVKGIITATSDNSPAQYYQKGEMCEVGPWVIIKFILYTVDARVAK